LCFSSSLATLVITASVVLSSISLDTSDEGLGGLNACLGDWDCLGEKANLDPEVERVENRERVSEKFGGVAGVFAGVMKARGDPLLICV